MKKLILILLLLAGFIPLAMASIDVKLTDETTQKTVEATEITKETKTYADIYVNENLLASGIEITDKTQAKETIQAYITKRNNDAGNKISVSDIANLNIEAVKIEVVEK